MRCVLLPLLLVLGLLAPAWAQPELLDGRESLARLIDAQPVLLTVANPLLRTTPIAIPAQADRVTLRLRRPTTAVPLVGWEITGRVQVTLVLMYDGQRLEYRGATTGGIRLDTGGVEQDTYSLAVTPTWGFFNGCLNPPQRLGERSAIAWTAHVELEHLAGTVTTELSVEVSESPSPTMSCTNTVAFDTATDVLESVGDGTVSLSHTNSGTTELAAFAGVSVRGANTKAFTSVTYGVDLTTESWEVDGTPFGHAGYTLANPATGAQTVTSVVVTVSIVRHYLGVMTLTGVDQAAPVGTAVTGSGATSPATITVGDAGADDMIVDNLATASNAPTIGADQTERNTEDVAGDPSRFRQSTQPGSADDVMSWTFTNATWVQGGIAFKASGAAPAAATVVPQRTMTGVGL